MNTNAQCRICGDTFTSCTNTGYGDSQEWYCLNCDISFEVKKGEK